MSIKRGRSLADIVADIDEPSASPETLEPSHRPVDPAPEIVPLNILVTPEDRRRLKQLSLDAGLSLQKLGHQAWNLLLESRGLPPLESVPANVPSGRTRRRN